MRSRAWAGVSASRTSTPARRNPVAVSASVITATLYMHELLACHVGREAELAGVRDHADVGHLGRLPGQVSDDHVDAERVAEQHLRGHALEGAVDHALHLEQVLGPGQVD